MPDLGGFSLSTVDLTDEMLACAELAQDPLYHKIPVGRIPYYVEMSLRRGREAAAMYRGKPIRELCRKEGLRYEITDRSGTYHHVSFRAQIDFAKSPPEIIIYASSLREMAQAYKAVMGNLDEEPALERLIDIHLAHEFFHYLEYRSGQFTNETLDKIEVFRLGGWYMKRSSVVKCSEIAAHAFCKSVMNLPYLPNVLDYMFLVQQGVLSAAAFDQEVNKWYGMLT